MLLQVISIVLLLCGVPATAASAPFTLDEAKAVFAACYAPEVTYAEESRVTRNSQYPGRIIPLWEEASCEISKKGKVTTYHIPFVGERLVFSYFSVKNVYHYDEAVARQNASIVTQELIIEKIANKGIDIYIKSWASSHEGRQPGKFWGMVSYININTPSSYMWEYWENGKCVDARDGRVSSLENKKRIEKEPFNTAREVTYYHVSMYDDNLNSVKGVVYPSTYDEQDAPRAVWPVSIKVRNGYHPLRRGLNCFRFLGQRNPEFQ